jgi:hypothetical protein
MDEKRPETESVPWRRLNAKPRRMADALNAWLSRLLGERLARAIVELLATPLVYLRDLVWENDQAYGFALLRGIWGLGWLGRSGLAFLLVGLLLVISVLARGAQPDQSLVLILTLAGFSLGWAFALAASFRAPLWAFVLANSYLLFYAILIGGSLAGSFPFALPALLTLACGWIMARGIQSRWRLLWLLLLCIVVGNLTFGAFGLGHIVPASWNLAGRILLGLLFFALLANPLTLPAKARPTPVKVRPAHAADAVIFFPALAVIVLFFTLAYIRDPALTGQNLLLSLRSLLGVVDLAWFWLGWTLFEGALDLGAWISARSMRILTPRVGSWLFPSLWGISAAFCWLSVHPVPLPFAVMADSIGLQAWVVSIDDSLYFALYDFLYAALALIGLVFILAPLKRLDTARIGWINGLWIAAFAALLWYYQSMSSFATLEADAVAPLDLWAGLLLVGGILWELARSGSSYLEPGSRPRVFAILSGLLFLFSISSFILALGLPDLVMEYTLYSFLGALYLGLPLALYTALPELIDYEPVAGLRLLGLFALGMLSAIVVMGIAYNAGPHLALAALLWALILWLAGKPLARLENRLDGIAGGSALALGFSVYWMSPQFLPLPFLTWVNEWEMRYLLQPLNRPMMQPGQALFTLLFLAGGAAIGLAFTAPKRRLLWIGLAFSAAALLFALLAPGIPGIPRA